MYQPQLDISPEDEAALANWTELELTQHLAERSDFIDQIKRYNEDYFCEPSSTPTTYPFVGASQIKIPLTAIAVEAVHARVMQQVDALDHLVSAKIFDTNYSKLKIPLANYMDQHLKYDIRFLPKLESSILELEKLGNGIAEAFYCRRTRIAQRNGQPYEYVVHDGADVESVPLANFLMPFESQDPQTARWCGKVFWLNKAEVQAWERDGRLREGTYERLANHYEASVNGDSSDYRDQAEELRNKEAIWPARIEFYELYTAFDFSRRADPDDEGSATECYSNEICYIYHRETRSVVSITENPNADLRRPYRIGKYFPLENTWTAVGIGKQNEMFQEEVTAQHRMRLDNSNINNLRMFKVNRNSDVKPDEPIFPGKLWFLDDINDIEPLEMGDVKASAYNNENQAQLYSQQRTGVNELTLGMPQIGTPGTAADSLSRVQESARKFDYSFSNIKEYLNELIHDVLCINVQWGPNKARLNTIEHGSELEAFLTGDVEGNLFSLFRNKVIGFVELVGQNQNKLIDRQNATQLSGMVQQYLTGLIELAQASGDQQLVPQIAYHGIEAANATMAHILQTFDFPDHERLLYTPKGVISVPSQQPTVPQEVEIPAADSGSQFASRLDARDAANQLAGTDVSQLLG